jgi:hypothetical protein
VLFQETALSISIKSVVVPVVTYTREYRSRLMTRMHNIKRKYAEKLGCPVHQILPNHCLELAHKLEKLPSVFNLHLFHLKNEFVNGRAKYRQAIGTFDGDTLYIKEIKSDKTNNPYAAIEAWGHVAFQSTGKVVQIFGQKITHMITRVEGDSYWFRWLLRELGFAWNDKQHAYVRL